MTASTMTEIFSWSPFNNHMNNIGVRHKTSFILISLIPMCLSEGEHTITQNQIVVVKIYFLSHSSHLVSPQPYWKGIGRRKDL
jgi:hypothetical protein